MSERHHREDERRWIAAMRTRHARGLEYVCGLADVLAVIEERDEAWAEIAAETGLAIGVVYRARERISLVKAEVAAQLRKELEA